MRTARRVIVCLLALVAAGAVWAQQPAPAEGSVDSSVTVMGRDDSVIAVPGPGDVQEEVLPPLDGVLAELERSLAGAAAPEAALVPPVFPPVAGISVPPRDALFMPVQPRPAVE